MGRSGNLTIAAALVMGAIAMPSAALAASGGAALPTSAATSTPPAAGSTLPASGEAVTVSANGITLTAHNVILQDSGLRITGSVPASEAGKTLVIQRLATAPGSAWAQATETTVAPGGSFAALWRSGQVGQFAIRAVVAGNAAASPSISVTVYPPSTATLYGPGLYGRHTACGRLLARATLGVANRALPCGTSVSVYYRGRTMVVPVIDRGPYANRANWDLTEATARALGMAGTATIGAIAVPSQQ